MKKKRDFKVTGVLATEARDIQDKGLAIRDTEKMMLEAMIEGKQELHKANREWWDKVRKAYNLNEGSEHELRVLCKEVRVMEKETGGGLIL